MTGSGSVDLQRQEAGVFSASACGGMVMEDAPKVIFLCLRCGNVLFFSAKISVCA
jgi:predicted RNA-binding Zn-ribbon protein involved in translation (DUF1610 family)